MSLQDMFEYTRPRLQQRNQTAPYMGEDGWQINFMFLEKDEDPDSFVRKIGKEKFEQSI